MSKWNKPYKVEDAGNMGVKETHGSFGSAGFSRVRGGERELFGSSIKHSEKICLRISTCSRYRHLNRYWYHPESEIIEVMMSQSQFVELITNMNNGSGVPVTLKHIEREPIDQTMYEDERKRIVSEFKERLGEVTEKMTQIKELQELLTGKGQLKASDKKKALGLVNHLEVELASNIPFVQESFHEAVDRTIDEAKQEVEAYVENKVRSLGLSSLQQLAAVETDLPQLEQGEDNE